MKRNIYSWLAVLPFIFIACQEDTLVENRQQDKIYTLSARVEGGALMSRAQIALDNTEVEKEFFMWNEGDKITLYQDLNGTQTEHVFKISNYTEEGEGDKKEATFVTDTPASVGAATAFYPSGLKTDLNGDSKTVVLALQDTLDFSQGTAQEVWKNYFKDNMLMRAVVTLSDEGDNVLNFEHLLSLARITYQNNSGVDQQVNKIILGGDQFYKYSLTVWLDYGWIGGMASNGYAVVFNNLTVKAGESCDFYILFGPEDFKEGDMDLHVYTSTSSANRILSLPTSTIAAVNNNATAFEAGKRYWFKITETEEGMAWTKDLDEQLSDTITIQNAELSKALYGVLGAEKVALNADSCAMMAKESVDSVTSLNFTNMGYTITSLIGIEKFVNLEDLRCNSTGLVSCDLSKNTALKVLMLSGNLFESLDLSSNVNLEVLYLESCRNLTSLKLDDCTKLGFVDFTSSRALTSFNVPNKAGLYGLDYASTALDIDLSEYTGLTTLKCSFMGLTELNLSEEAKSKLTLLECSGNNLGDLDFSGYTGLEILSCFNAGVTSLQLGGNTKIITLMCQNNKIKTLDITDLGNLERLQCGNQQDSIVLQLKLTDAQKATWESNWSTNSLNGNVELYTESDDAGDENTGTN